MNIVPVDKFDIQACERLAIAADSEVVSKLDELIEWTQDTNWPVALPVINRLKSLGFELVPQINRILSGSDATWKWFVINTLLPELTSEIQHELKESLQRLVEFPSKTDQEEEVALLAQEFLNEL